MSSPPAAESVPDSTTPPQRSVAGRIAGYPLVTILIGFVLFLFVLQAIVFGNPDATVHAGRGCPVAASRGHRAAR